MRPQIWLSSLPLIVPLPWYSDNCPWPLWNLSFQTFWNKVMWSKIHTGLENAHFVSIAVLSCSLLPSPPLPPQWTLNPFIHGDWRQSICFSFPASPLASLAFLLSVWMLFFMAPCQWTDVNDCLIAKGKRDTWEHTHHLLLNDSSIVCTRSSLWSWLQDSHAVAQVWDLRCTRNKVKRLGTLEAVLGSPQGQVLSLPPPPKFTLYPKPSSPAQWQ